MVAVAKLPPLPENSPGDTWPQSLVTNFLSFNPPQYESNHHKQHLLICKSKISHWLPQILIRKSKKIFYLRSACDYEFHTTLHSTCKAHLFNSARKIKGKISLGPRKKFLIPPSCTQNVYSLDLHQKQEDEILDSPCLP